MTAARAMVLLLLSSAPLAAQAPKLPYVLEGTCTVECCDYGRWRARSRTTAFVRPDTTSRVAFIIGVGDTVDAPTGDVLTTAPGIVTFSDLLWVDLDVYSPGRAPNGGPYHVLSLPTSDWWAKVTNARGPTGWVFDGWRNFDSPGRCG